MSTVTFSTTSETGFTTHDVIVCFRKRGCFLSTLVFCMKSIRLWPTVLYRLYWLHFSCFKANVLICRKSFCAMLLTDKVFKGAAFFQNFWSTDVFIFPSFFKKIHWLFQIFFGFLFQKTSEKLKGLCFQDYFPTYFAVISSKRRISNVFPQPFKPVF